MNDKENKYGIEESKEIIAYVDAIADKLVEAKAGDGKIDGGEIAATLAATAPEGVKAVWGSWEAPKELGDLTEEERKELLDSTFPVILKIFGLFIPVSAK